MPSRDRRREFDSRAPRFESEIRTGDFQSLCRDGRIVKKIYMCSNCHRSFEERSRNCPRCDRKSMGEIRHLNADDAAQAKRKSLERLRSKYVRHRP